MASTCTAANLLLLTMVVVVATADYYAPPGPPPIMYPPPQPYVPKTTTTYMAIEGFILCKSGYKTYPIQGATTFSILCVTFHDMLPKTKNVCLRLSQTGNVLDRGQG